MTPLESVMTLSTPNIETGCRIWKGKTDPEGEPLIRARGNWVSVKRYLTASKRKRNRKGFYPVFENTCGNRHCVTVGHLRITDWIAR